MSSTEQPPSTETRQLGLMYHRDDSAEVDSALHHLRTDVVDWLGRAVRRGLAIGLVRKDIPADLAVELTVSVLSMLDRWAVDRAMHSPGSSDAARLSLTLIWNLIAAPEEMWVTAVDPRSSYGAR